jgi:hypothetical protein
MGNGTMKWWLVFVLPVLLGLLAGAGLMPARTIYAEGILPTATPDAALAAASQAQAPAAPTPQPDYLDLSQVVPAAEAPPLPTYLPMLMRHYRPQAPKVGVALQGFFDAAGWQQTLALQPRYVRRYVEIAWRDVEPQEGSYRWEVLAPLEEELKTAAASNARPILNVQMTPEWAQKVKGNACGPVAPEKLEAFATFMEQLVQRYGSGTEYGVRYWQIGNEPDIAIGIVPGESVFGCWGDRSDPYYGGGYYGEMLKVVYPRIKAADPNAQVMMGGLLLECDPYMMTVPATCKNDDRLQSGFFLEGVLKAGAGDFFDVLDVHGYGTLRIDLPSRMSSQYTWSPPAGGTGLPEKVAFVRRLLAQYEQPDKAIVTTEVALKCEEPSAECQDVGAAYIPRVYAEAHQLGLDFAVFYALITEFKYKGLLLEDLSPKQQYHAFRYMASQLSWVEYVKPVDQYPGISGAEFNQSRLRRLWIVWSSDGTDQSLTLPGDFVQAYDKYGNVVPLTEDGRLVVGWSPVYVELKLQNE